jgi:hypothetical protein
MQVLPQGVRGRRRANAEDVSFADFRRLIDEQYGLGGEGIGESLMQRGGEFCEMIRYTRSTSQHSCSNHIWVRTATNASLLNLRDNYRNW